MSARRGEPHGRRVRADSAPDCAVSAAVLLTSRQRCYTLHSTRDPDLSATAAVVAQLPHSTSTRQHPHASGCLSRPPCSYQPVHNFGATAVTSGGDSLEPDTPTTPQPLLPNPAGPALSAAVTCRTRQRLGGIATSAISGTSTRRSRAARARSSNVPGPPSSPTASSRRTASSTTASTPRSSPGGSASSPPSSSSSSPHGSCTTQMSGYGCATHAARAVLYRCGAPRGLGLA